MQAANYYRDLQTRSQQAARQEGAILTAELVEGDKVRAMVECIAGCGITPPTILYSS